MKVVEGNLVAPKGVRFALLAARFNEFVVDQLVSGARETLLRHGVPEESLTLVKVPGCWDLPPVARRLAMSKRFDAIVALGAVIRGATPHFDYVAGEASSGLARVSLETLIPVAFGVLTTDTVEQAIERAGTKAGNKGADAALVALELLNLGQALEGS
jgi:6,7-dimethyl-8-ribityllumazine synthase